VSLCFRGLPGPTERLIDFAAARIGLDSREGNGEEEAEACRFGGTFLVDESRVALDVVVSVLGVDGSVVCNGSALSLSPEKDLKVVLSSMIAFYSNSELSYWVVALSATMMAGTSPEPILVLQCEGNQRVLVLLGRMEESGKVEVLRVLFFVGVLVSKRVKRAYRLGSQGWGWGM